MFYSKKKRVQNSKPKCAAYYLFHVDRECESANDRLFRTYTQQILRLTWMVICDNVSCFNFVHKAFHCGVLKMNVIRSRIFHRTWLFEPYFYDVYYSSHEQ